MVKRRGSLIGISILLGLSACFALGMQFVTYSGAAVHATGDNIVADTAEAFTFTSAVGPVVIVNNSAVAIYAKFNSTTVATTGVGGWDDVIPANTTRSFGLWATSRVDLIASSNLTYGTDFAVWTVGRN